MKNVSTALKKYIKNGGAFYTYAVVTLSTGEKLVLTSEKDFMCNGNSYSEQGGSNGFPLGEALSKTITITIDNMDERFSKYDFYYSRIAMYTEADIEYAPWKDASGNDIGDINGNPIYISEPALERIPEGVFTVLNPVSVGDIIELTAYDDMWKTDKAYNPGIPFPATARQVLVDVCGSCGVTVGSATFPNEDFQIINSPENLTCRQAVGYIAQIACGNAVVQNGSLYIKTYDFGAFSGITDETVPEKLSETAGYHILSEFKEDPDIDTDNVIITGISTVRGEGNEEETVLYGKDTYCLKINNPLIKDVEEKAVAYLGKKLCGTVLRKFSGSFFADPTVEFMDLACVVDRKNKVYRTLITSHEFEYLGGSRYSCDINSPVRQAGEYYSNATAIYQAQKETKKNKKEWEKAVENMNVALENASGMFPTEVPQPDGSSIVYIHDKKTLEESKNVFKITSAAVGFSTDGGKTYPFGFMLTGEFIAKILYTIGINADYINTGAITVKDSDGNIIFQADIANKRVIISGDYVQIGGKTVPEKLNEVNAQIEIINGKIKSVVTKDDVTSIIEQSADSIRLQAKKLTWEAENSSLKEDGSFSCKNANISGNLTSFLDTEKYDFSSEISETVYLKRGSKTTGYGLNIKGKNKTSTSEKYGGLALIPCSDYYRFSQQNEENYTSCISANDKLIIQAQEVSDDTKAKYVSIEFDTAGTPGLQMITSASQKVLFYIDQSGARFSSDSTMVNNLKLTTYKTVTESPDLYIDGTYYDGNYSGYVCKSSSSSRRYKTNITKVDEELNTDALYNLPVKSYTYKENYLSETDRNCGKRMIGFIAEDVDKIYPKACQYDEEGKPEMWNSKILIPAMLDLIQKQHAEIEKIKEKLNEK